MHSKEGKWFRASRNRKSVNNSANMNLNNLMKQLLSRNIVFAVFAYIQIVARAAGVDISPEIERAILSEDWKTVSELVPASVNDSGPAILRLIRGHACLALNRNNDSVTLLRDSGKNEDAS